MRLAILLSLAWPALAVTALLINDGHEAMAWLCAWGWHLLYIEANSDAKRLIELATKDPK